MALVDFYQQSSLFNLGPHDPNLPSGFLNGSTSHLEYNGDPGGDLENHGVFVDIEYFMETVLHVPADWRTQWGPIIRAAKGSPDFMKHYLEHRGRHKKIHPRPKESHYESLLLMNDATIRAAFPTVISQDATSTPVPLGRFVHIVDDGSSDSILNHGSLMPRLIAKGERSPPSYAPPPSEATPVSAPETTRKRKRDSETTPERKKPGPGVTSAPGRANPEINMGACSTTSPPHRRKQLTEVGRRLTDLLSLRPHVTVGLVDRNRIQFYHANHTVVLVSSVIDLSDDEGGIDRFIAFLIAFHYLFIHDKAVLENGRNGTTLRLEGNGKVKGPIEIELGTVISMAPSLVGRSTVVMDGTSPKWPDRQLVVKISWVDDFRASEQEFMDKAVEEGTKSGHEWTLNHLPQFFYAEDVDDPTYRSVHELFENARFVNKEYTYGRRQMRIVVQEPLEPLETLTNVKDVGQVILDAACVHRWLYDRAGILHGDISLGNIMYRTIGGEVYGVLTDFDLSLWTTSPTPDRSGTPQQMAGTPPFMAHGLLSGTDTIRLYRHDLESLFYVMLIVATLFEIRTPKEGVEGGLWMREGKLQFQNWFNTPNRKSLGAIKSTVFTKPNAFEVSPSFQDFRDWLRKLHMSFGRGFITKWTQLSLLDKDRIGGSCGESTHATFDEETLGGHVTYSAVINPTRHLTGKLEGLVIRYDPSPPSSLTSASATVAQADA